MEELSTKLGADLRGRIRALVREEAIDNMQRLLSVLAVRLCARHRLQALPALVYEPTLRSDNVVCGTQSTQHVLVGSSVVRGRLLACCVISARASVEYIEA